MPVIYLLAGPNGTGKTTFYSSAIQAGLINHELPFINVDLIAQSLGGYTKANYVMAPELYRVKVQEHIAGKHDFMIESNLAEDRNYEWIASMKKAGYKAVLYYLSTDDVETNISRVRRVAEGGHDIPETIIRSRYLQSHSYLKTRLREFIQVFLIDNSTDVFQVQAQLTNGKIIFKASDAVQWINDVLSITERLQNKIR